MAKKDKGASKAPVATTKAPEEPVKKEAEATAEVEATEAEEPKAEPAKKNEPDRSAEREAENAKESKALAKELGKGFYWRVSVPGHPVVSVQKKTEEDAIDLYNRWAGITQTDHPHQTEKVPKKGPRVYEIKGKNILYGASGEPGKSSVSLPPTAANTPG